MRQNVVRLNPKPVAGEPGPVGVTLSLSSETLMPGEPLTLFCTVTNALPEMLDTYMGMDMESWLVYQMVDAMGQEVPALPDPRVQNPGGIHTTGARLSPRGKFTWAIVLSQRFAVSRSGVHSLSVRVHLPYAPDDRDKRVQPEQFEEVYGTVFLGEHKFSLLVTEADPSRLRLLAEAAADEIIQRLPQGEQGKIEALFSMPEEYALPSWKRVVDAARMSHTGTRQGVASELTRLNSIAAADLLADMIWNPTQPLPSSEPGHIATYLHNMYFQNGPGLKAHIAEIFIRRGLALPKDLHFLVD